MFPLFPLFPPDRKELPSCAWSPMEAWGARRGLVDRLTFEIVDGERAQGAPVASNALWALGSCGARSRSVQGARDPNRDASSTGIPVALGAPCHRRGRPA